MTKDLGYGVLNIYTLDYISLSHCLYSEKWEGIQGTFDVQVQVFGSSQLMKEIRFLWCAGQRNDIEGINDLGLNCIIDVNCAIY